MSSVGDATVAAKLPLGPALKDFVRSALPLWGRDSQSSVSGDTLPPLHTRAVIFSTLVSPVREVQTFEQKKGSVQKLQLDLALAAVVTSELEACDHQNLPHEIIGEIFSIYESKLVCRKPMEYQDWVIPFYITKIHLGKLSCTFN